MHPPNHANLCMSLPLCGWLFWLPPSITGTPNWSLPRSMQPHGAYSCYACRTDWTCRRHPNGWWCWSMAMAFFKAMQTKKKKTPLAISNWNNWNTLTPFCGQKSYVERERRYQKQQHDCSCMHVLPLPSFVQLPQSMGQATVAKAWLVMTHLSFLLFFVGLNR